MFFSHFAMQSNYLFQWMKPSFKVMIFLQQIDKRISCKAGSQERYQPPQNPPPKKQQCKNQDCLASYKKKLIACARVRCKRRVDSVAASPREYLVRRAAKNVISPPKPPKETTMQKSRVSCKLQEEVDSVCQGQCKRRVDSVAASPREYLVRRAAKNVISPPQNPPKQQQCKNQECLASYKKKLIACARVRCKRRVDSVAASPREYLVRRAAKNVISPPQNPPKPTAVYTPWSNYTAKIYHQCLRTHLVNTWEASLSHLQCGGRPGIGADIAHHVVQCHQAWAKHAACPSAILLLDFRSAFYTVLRQTLTSLPSSNAAFVKAMHQLGLSEEETERMVITAEQDHATDGLSLHSQHILQDMMQCKKMVLKPPARLLIMVNDQGELLMIWSM